MKISESLAEKIISEVGGVFNKNINIFNPEGKILSSKNKDRIGHYHEIARKAAQNGEICEVNQQEAKDIKNVEKGINLPLKINGEVIGVVGITGEVSEVKKFGEMIEKFVELILEREFMNKEKEIRKNVKENFYQALLSSSYQSINNMKDRANLLGINLEKKRVVFVINFKIFQDYLVSEKIESIYNKKFVNEDDMFMVRGEDLIWIKAMDNFSYDNKKSFKILAKRLQEELKNISDCHIGIGGLCENLINIDSSYKEAKMALKISKNKNLSETNIVYIKDLKHKYLLYYISEDIFDSFVDTMDYEKILSKFDKDLGVTMEALIENNLNITKAAEKMHIHRNTLKYRLDKYEECLDIDLKDARQLTSFYLLYELYLFHNYQSD